MDTKIIREIINEEIDKRINEVMKAQEGIVKIKTPSELKAEQEQIDKDWIQQQL